MKKLVYILTIVTGLIMTGCAKFEHEEPLSPNTWGPLSEMTIVADSACLDETQTSIVKEELLLHVTLINANYFACIVTDEPQPDMDYTALLIADDYRMELDADTARFTITETGIEAGKTYYLYAVSTNAAGVQTTLAKAFGAIDVDAPQPLTDFHLAATQGGRRATIAFNENILRDETMGAITFKVYNLDTNELLVEGDITDAVAAGSNLAVTLPTTVEFDEVSNYLVLLSFAEGAVTDLSGNKMKAIEAVYNAEEMNVENGYYWFVSPSGNNDEPTEFFADGDYVFNGVFTYDGKDYYEGDIPFSMSFVSDGYDMGNIFENAPFTGTRWELKGVAKAMFEGDEYPFPGFSYEYVSSQDGLTYKYITIIDPENGWIPCVGNVPMQDGSVFKAYLAAVTEEGEMYPYWDFVLADADLNVEAPVEDLLGHFSLEATPCILIDQNEGTGQDPKWGILVMFDSVTLSRGGAVEAASYKVYKEPLTLENVKMNLGKLSLEKDFLFNK